MQIFAFKGMHTFKSQLEGGIYSKYNFTDNLELIFKLAVKKKKNLFSLIFPILFEQE